MDSLGAIIEWVGYLHWVMGGDLNHIQILEEKRGGNRVLNKISESFSEKIPKWDLIDLKIANHIFTWSNKRMRERKIASRRDRFPLS